MKRSMAVLGMLCAASAAWATLVVDDFNRANTPVSSDTSLIGANWKQTAGSTDEWIISGNYLHSHALASPGILYNDALQTVSGSGSNFTLSLDVASKTSGAWAGVVFNYQDGNNYYMARFKSDASGFQMIKVVNGNLGVMQYGTTAANFSEDVFYTMTIESDAPYVFDITITEAGETDVFGSGTQRTDTGSNFTGGYGGTYANSAGYSAGFDNFSLQVVPEPATFGLLGLAGAAIMFARKRFTI